jgi:hypothetical protein
VENFLARVGLVDGHFKSCAKLERFMHENAVSEHKGAVSTSMFCCSVADDAIKM